MFSFVRLRRISLLLFFCNISYADIDDYFPYKVEPSPSNYGNTGILEIPNARFMSPASLRFHYSNSYPIGFTSLTATPFPWLEATYRYAEIKNRKYGPVRYSGNQTLKDKDKSSYPTLRLIVSAIKDAEIANRSKENKQLTDSDVVSILKKMIKQRNESCEIYKKASRQELLDTETKEINIISGFLPKQLSDEETKKICEEVIKSLGANSIKDMGKVIGQIKSKYSDTLDFSKVSSIIKQLLK